MNTRQFYICMVGINEEQYFFIWYTDERDGVVVNDEHHLITFASEADAAIFAAAHKIALAEGEPAFFDLDQISCWCKSPNKYEVDCEEFLNAWNLFNDLISSCNAITSLYSHSSKKNNDVYNKLFFGNNLPSITPEGEHYEPEWSEDELKRLKDTLELGLSEFRHRLTQGSA